MKPEDMLDPLYCGGEERVRVDSAANLADAWVREWAKETADAQADVEIDRLRADSAAPSPAPFAAIERLWWFDVQRRECVLARRIQCRPRYVWH
jgi:hypothetical protein